MKLVKCPNCGKVLKTKGKTYFLCCGMAFLVNKCLMTDLNGYRYAGMNRPQKLVIVTED